MAARRSNHPPEPGEFHPPTGDRPALFWGADGPAGYGMRDFYIALVPRRIACDIIIANHYSGRVVANSYVHMGVYRMGVLVGVLQWGYALNPARTAHIVAGSTSTDYLELNRMWLSDDAPRNSESRAISYALHYVRRAMPWVRWVQSFADERCGRWGVVYQACSFLYVGYHRSTFWHLDGEWFHKIAATAATRGGVRGARLRADLARATRHEFRQFRYVFMLRRDARRDLKLKPLPYPKPGTHDDG